jgi:hypothetical protein
MELDVEIAQVKEDLSQFKIQTKDDIKDLYRLSNGYVDRQARMEVKVETVSGDVRRLDDKFDKRFSELVLEIKALSSVPGQRWNTLITVILSSGVGVILTLLAKQLIK